MGDHLAEIKDSIIGGRHKEIEEVVKEAIADSTDLNKIINEAMIGAMDVVGERFAHNEIFVPEMLASAVTMKKGLNLIKPLLKEGDAESRGTIVMGTVKGDIHDIGKNIVIMMLEGAGFHVIDLGVDLPLEELIGHVEKIQPEILGLSALLTNTMPELKNVIETLGSKGLRTHVKVMVGGAPVDASFAERIGADGYGADATEAVKLARRFMSGK